jgi:hypothetical protein
MRIVAEDLIARCVGNDRRGKPEPGDRSPMASLKRLPVLVVLERIPVPVLATDSGGRILFANTFNDGWAPTKAKAVGQK